MAGDILLRIGRRLTWWSPTLYRPIGRLRGREHYQLKNYDAWVGGFPRSSNTFTAKALARHVPELRVVSHVHLPPPIIQAVREGKPGLFVIRNPADAVVSWVQYSHFSLAHCLHYYCDFHRALRPYADRLLVARFEETTGDFEAVMRRFGERYGLHVRPEAPDMDCICREIDNMWRNEDGSINEAQVARPSPAREAGRGDLHQKLRAGAGLRSDLARAEDLYALFTAALPPLSPRG